MSAKSVNIGCELIGVSRLSLGASRFCSASVGGFGSGWVWKQD